MSYGEPSGRPNAGRFLEKARIAVLEKGVAFFASAGNAGPALSTVGAPGGCSAHIIGVGAAVSRAMMDEQYALRVQYSAAAGGEGGEGGAPGGGPLSPPRGGASGAPALAPAANARTEDTNFTWSSRGPAMDGGLGVSICAPGGAITCVPTWCLARHQQMNGTSMSSPNAAGCAALLLSGLLARGLPWTPYALRRALEASAAPIPGSPDAFTAGHGMLQVGGAWERLVAAGEAAAAAAASPRGDAYPFGAAAGGGGGGGGAAATPFAAAPPSQPVLEVTVPSGGAGVGEASDRGIYLRDPAQSAAAGDATVWVTPVWRDCAPPAARVSFQQRVALSTSAPGWVSVPSHITLASGARSFTVHVDPRALAPGRAHYAEVVGAADGADPLGPLFRIPITVIKPEAPTLGPSACTYAFAPREGADCVMHTAAAAAAAGGAPPAPPPAPQGAPEGALALTPGRIHRRFISIPHGATWAEILVRRVDGGAAGGAASPPRAPSPAAAAPPRSARAAPPSPSPLVGLEEAARGAQDALARALSPGAEAAPLSPRGSAARAPAPAPAGAPPAAPPAADASLRLLVVHAMQLCRNVSPRATAEETYLRLAPGEADGISLPLFPGGRTLEVAVAQFWSALGGTLLEVGVRFHGVASSAGEGGVALTTAAGFAPLTLTPLLHDVALRPVGKLTSWTTALEPLGGKDAGAVTPLPGGRDTPLAAAPAPAPAFALTLRYRLALGADCAGASLRLPALTGLLYESGIDAQLAVVAAAPAAGKGGRRGGGRVVAASDAFPEKLKLKKGEYTVHVQLRSESRAKLAALAKAAPALEFTRRLEGAAEAALGVAGAHPGGAGGGAAVGRLRAGLPQTVFVTAPAAASLPKELKAGDSLGGWLLLEDAVPRTLLKLGRAYGEAPGAALVGRHPRGLPVTLFCNSPAAKEKDAADAPAPTAKAQTPAEALADALRAAALAKLKGFKPGAAAAAAAGAGGGEAQPPLPAPFGGAIPAALDFEALAAATAACSPAGHVPLLAARLAAADEEGVASAWAGEPPAPPAPLAPLAPAPTLLAAAALAAAIDARELAAYFGVRHEAPPGAAKALLEAEAAEAKRRADDKAALVDALWRAVRAQCHAAWAAASLGNAAVQGVPPAAPRSGGGSAAAAAAAPPLPAAPALPPPPPGDGFEAAVAALNAWAPTTGAAGPHAPLIAVERALRAGKWAVALEAAQKAAAGSGLGGMHPLTCELLKLHCMLALGWARPAARLVEAMVMNFTAWPVMM
jgi:hypothetical protein